MIQTNRPPVRVGIVGLGRAGLEMHVPELLQYPELFKIVAVCDTIKERRDAVLQYYPSCRTYRRYEDLLLDPDVELVDVATRSEDHREHILAGLKSGKWVNAERPFCRDEDEAKILRAAAVRYGNKLLLRYNYRYEPAFLMTKEVAESGLLGEVYEIRMCRGTYVRRDDWQTVKRCLGGALLCWGPAFLDQALELLKTPPVKIYSDMKRIAAYGDAEDYVRIILHNFSGLTVDLEISGGRCGRDPLFQVSGDRGEFRIYPGDDFGTARYLDPENKLERRRSSVRTPPLGSFGSPETLVWVEQRMPIKPKAECGMTLIWEHVFNAIRENKPYPITLESASELMRVLSLVKKESGYAR